MTAGGRGGREDLEAAQRFVDEALRPGATGGVADGLDQPRLLLRAAGKTCTVNPRRNKKN